MSHDLLIALRALAADIGGDLKWFAERMHDLPQTPATPNPQPVCASLPARCAGASALTAPVRDALLAAAPGLPWVQSYTTEDAGFDRHYLDNYAFVNIVSPHSGLYRSDEMRVTVGFWGEGLIYPDHAHQPEEWYVMLAGTCDLTSAGSGTRACGPGDVVHHAPWQRHSASFIPGPLLACAYWRGDGLMDKSAFYGAP